jgi:mRNA interferase MazF
VGRIVKRGDVVTVAAGSGFGGKPRPAVVVQASAFGAHTTIILCPFTTNPVDAPDFRVRVEPSVANALTVRSSLMIDKLITVPRTKIGRQIGQLSAADITRLDQALLLFLGLAG